MGNNRLLVKEKDVLQANIILEILDQPLSKDELNKIKEQAVEEEIEPSPNSITSVSSY